MKRLLLMLSLLSALAGCGGDDNGANPPAVLSGVSAFAAAQGDAQLALAWTNPDFAGFAGVEIRRDTSAPPANRTEGVLIYDGPGPGFLDTGLSNGARYFYTAFAHDGGGRFAPGVGTDGVPNPAGPVPITFAGVGAGAGSHGIFDPSLAADPATGRIWMSYSEVVDSALWPGQNAWIQTRLAYSDDRGLNWADSGAPLNAAQDVTLPFAAPNNAGTWVNEVSCLVHDPAAPAAERWRLMWHHYLVINGIRAFNHGWIALRTADDPAGVWSPERKLFAGAFYDSADDNIIGPPELQLDRLHPDLHPTLVFSEPGLLATASGLYATMLAADATAANGRIILLRRPTGASNWQYRGSLLVNAQDGPALGCDGLSAPALYAHRDGYRLLATPQTGDFYQGTLEFRVTSLEDAAVERTGSLPRIIFSQFGSVGSFNGAAGYAREATASGVIYSEAKASVPIVFEMYSSRRNP